MSPVRLRWNIGPIVYWIQLGKAVSGISMLPGRTDEGNALASCLIQPFADVVLSGAVTEEQVLSNIRSCSLNLDPDAMSRLMALAEPAQSYWATRKNLPWN
jgi:aryl-alcohol dehydrogenase-like predicted oxidoreductase